MECGKVSEVLAEAFYNATTELENKDFKQDTKGYNYTYLQLPTLLEIIKPVLKKYSLTMYQEVDDEYVYTYIQHKKGEYKRHKYKIIYLNDVKITDKDNAIQKGGSVVTYSRRYALYTLFGIQPEKDDDGAKLGSSDYKKGDNKKSDVEHINYFNKNLKDAYTFALMIKCFYKNLLNRSKEPFFQGENNGEKQMNFILVNLLSNNDKSYDALKSLENLIYKFDKKLNSSDAILKFLKSEIWNAIKDDIAFSQDDLKSFKNSLQDINYNFSKIDNSVIQYIKTGNNK